jgi:hypothetical protein
VAENEGWTSASAAAAAMSAAALQVAAFPLPAGSRDSPVLLALPPGPFTAQVSGVDGMVGIALIEIYEMP